MERKKQNSLHSYMTWFSTYRGSFKSGFHMVKRPIHKNQMLFSTSSDNSKSKVNKTPFTVVSNNTFFESIINLIIHRDKFRKNLGTNLTKNICKTCTMFIDWNAVKMLIHFTLANGFKAIPMKSEVFFFFLRLTSFF